MSWLRWILAYLFDCVHPHTTWPRHNRTGYAYVCCLDCGRELPYSLQRMRIVTRGELSQDRNRGGFGAHSAARASLILVSLWGLLLFNSDRAIAQTSEPPAAQTQIATSTASGATPTLVVGFVGGFVHSNDLRHSEVQLAQHLQVTYGDRVRVQVFKNRERAKAHKAIVEWFNGLATDTSADEEELGPHIILFGHSWGASAVVYLARQLERDGIPVTLTIQIDSVRKGGEDDSVIPGNVAEAVNFYQGKGIIHGRSKIIAADPVRTAVLGNFSFEYDREPAECHAYPWYDRVFFKGHTSIECDPRVWSQVQRLIEARLPRTIQPAQAEVAALFTQKISSH